jgi:hypothetical protein
MTFELESYVANGPPRNEIPSMLEFTPLNAEDASNVIFELPHQDRLHTILLSYRDVKNRRIGFDICTSVHLTGARDEGNGFEWAKQITTIRYITLQGKHSKVRETKLITFYLKDDSDGVNSEHNGPVYNQEHASLEYTVEVKHSYKSASLLDFGATINIVPKKCAMIHQH